MSYRRVLALVGLALCLFSTSGTVPAMASILGASVATTPILTTVGQTVPLPGGFNATLLQQAPTDEWFFGLGDPRNTYCYFSLAAPSQLCPGLSSLDTTGGQQKINGSYVWGLTEATTLG